MTVVIPYSGDYYSDLADRLAVQVRQVMPGVCVWKDPYSREKLIADGLWPGHWWGGKDLAVAQLSDVTLSEEYPLLVLDADGWMDVPFDESDVPYVFMANVPLEREHGDYEKHALALRMLGFDDPTPIHTCMYFLRDSILGHWHYWCRRVEAIRVEREELRAISPSMMTMGAVWNALHTAGDAALLPAKYKYHKVDPDREAKKLAARKAQEGW